MLLCYDKLYFAMHAYLIIGSSEKGVSKAWPISSVADNIEKLLKILKASPYEFLLNKIEDTRYLAKLTSLSINKPTAYIIKNIDQATTEALNSFLKNLEEPQENLYYILTADSLAKVLPTIISRCQIIKIQNSKLKIQNENTERFLDITTGERLAYCDNIKSREEAKAFVIKIINHLHVLITSASENHSNLATNLETASSSLNNLEANGNVNLQLANMVVNLD